ncbi:hypothetical protein [Myroides odoratus]|jgi:hypothetical protein|uniref:Uncharacterized protein n=1 Tax=Myroides odoratus TaxID=256 RepID=A0A9Q7EA22_MYROD|nr:hypothetical protein [Myroides odoratus]EHQ41983.1 hypothetical protein Myrod_1150 [Myroides odoratus DSM 2801]EKB03540.1 hypothetical protein HMPREF9716_03570 [Myroides odoratus CIP 103059]MDR0223532.1 hypothetical protein [Myroides odoratus]QQT99373.1 hypothetical protein I6I88_14400 [Myroides odoratus]WQD58426.1 hypothetical protein U0010_04560 [Myroides odoratus]
MNLGEYIVNLIDGILDFFQLIKDYLEDALSIFEKIKEVVLDILDYFSAKIEDLTEEASTLFEDTDEEYFFI